MTDGTSRWVYELYETLFPKKFDSSNSTPTVNYVLTSDGDNTLSWNAVSGSGLVALNDITDVTISSPATGTLLFYNGSNWVNATSSDTIIIPGNLTVSGTTTTINTETIKLADNIIVLNSNATGNASENAGIEVERGDDTNVLFRYNETSNKWEFTNDGSTYVSLATNTDSLTEGSTNLYYNQTRFDTAFSAKSTSDLSEGTNLYYTSTRFDTAFGGKDTDDLSEGSSNLYFTNARAVDAIEAVADATPVASDKVIFNDAGQLKQVAFSSLTNAILSGIDSGDITEVVAGAGLTDGGSSGSVTLNVGAGTGVTVNANDIAIGQDVATTSNVTFGGVNINTTGTDAILTLTSTDTSSSASPVIDLVRDSSSPASADYLGQIKFKGENSTGGSVVYSKITGKIDDETASAEDGIIEFAVQRNSTQTIVMRLKHDKLLLLNSQDLEVGGDITATTYGGITEANLLDKSATETITGAYRFDGQVHIDTATNTVPLIISRVGSTTNENLKIGVDDTGAYFTHKQDETASSHFFQFDIESSTSAERYYTFKTGGTQRVRISDAYVSFAGQIKLVADGSTTDNYISLGTGTDVRMYYDGSHFYVDTDQVAQSNTYFDTKSLVARLHDRFVIQDTDDSNETIFDLNTGGRTLTIGATDGNDDVDTTFYGKISLGKDGSSSADFISVGASDDLKLYHASNNSYVINTAVGGLYLENAVTDGGIFLRADRGGSQANYVWIDGSAEQIKMYEDLTIIKAVGSSKLTMFALNDTSEDIFTIDAQDTKYGVAGTDVFLSNMQGTFNQRLVLVDGNATTQDMFQLRHSSDGFSSVDNLVLSVTGDGDVETGGKYISDKGTATTGTFAEFKVDTDRVMSISYPIDDGGFEFDNNNYYVFKTDGGERLIIGDTFLRLPDSIELRLGQGNDFRLVHDGTNSNIVNYTGDIKIQQTVDDASILFQSDDGSGGINTYIDIDGSITKTVFAKATRHNDSVNAEFGSDSDAYIYHNDTNFVVTNNKGEIQFTQNVDDGIVRFYNDNGSGGLSTYFTIDGSSERNVSYKDFMIVDSEKLYIGSGDDVQMYHDTNDTYFDFHTGHLYITQYADDQWIRFYSDNGSGGTEEYLRIAGSTQAIYTFNKTGVLVDGSTSADFLFVGASEDFKIFHDGSNTYLHNDIGTMYFENNTVGDMIFKTGSSLVEYFRIDTSESATLFKQNTRHQDNIYAYFGSGNDASLRYDGSYLRVNSDNMWFDAENGSMIFDSGNDFVWRDEDDSNAELLKLNTSTRAFTIGSATDDVYISQYGYHRIVADGSSSNNYFSVGAGDDLKIYHSGSASYINNLTNDLIFQNDDSGGSNVEYMRFDASANIIKLSKTLDLTDEEVRTNYGTYDKTIINTQLIDLSKTANLVPSDWVEDTSGSASTELYNQNGADTENSIVWGDGSTYPLSPHGSKALLWRAESDGDNSSHGGFVSDQVKIDHTETYQFSVWIYWVDKGDASGYHGVVESSTDILNLDGTSNTNPYFRSNLQTANVVAGEWFLSVGYVHGSGTTGTTSYGAVYRQLDGSVATASTDFRFTTSATTIGTRAFLYYDSSGDAEAFFFDPRIHLVDGSEPSPQQLLGSDPRDFVTLSTAQTISGAKTFSGNVLLDSEVLYFGASTTEGNRIKIDQTTTDEIKFSLSDGGGSSLGFALNSSSYPQIYSPSDSYVLFGDAIRFNNDMGVHFGSSLDSYIRWDSANSTLALRSNAHVTVTLDDNNNSDNEFRINNGGDSTVFTVDESGKGHFKAGDSTNGLSTAISLELGEETVANGALKLLNDTSASMYSIIHQTNNLHIDTVGGNIYLGYYDATNIYYALGTTNYRLESDGDIVIKDVTLSGAIRSNTDVTVHLDDNADGSNVFRIRNSGDTSVFEVDESGNITNTAFTIPSSIGSAGQVLRVPSSGTTLEWGTITGSGGTDNTLNANITDVLALSTQEIQAVDNGANGTVVWDDSANKLTYKGTSAFRSHIGLSTTSNVTFANITGSAISGTTIGGITEANLLDKTATETITGAYTFNASSALVAQQASADIQIKLERTTTSAGWMGIGANSAGFQLYNSSTQKQMQISQSGVITLATWNGVAIASAYLDSDTAHLSETQTFTGAKTFSADTTFTGGNYGIYMNDTGDNNSIRLDSQTGYWSYIRFESGSDLFDIGVNDNNNSESFQIRHAGSDNQATIFDSNGSMTLQNLAGGANRTVDMIIKANQYAGGNTDFDTKFVVGLSTNALDVYGYISAPQHASTSVTEMIRFYDSHTEFNDAIRIATNLSDTDYLNIYKQATTAGINVLGGDDLVLQADGSTYITLDNSADDVIVSKDLVTSSDIYVAQTKHIYFDGGTAGDSQSSAIYTDTNNDRLKFRAEETDGVFELASYGGYFPKNSQTALYVQGGMIIDYANDRNTDSGFYFGNARDTGFYASATDTITFTDKISVSSTISTPFSGSSSTPNFQANGGNFRIYNNTNTYLYNDSGGGNIYLYNDDLDKGIQFFLGTGGFKIYEENPSTEIFRITEDGAISTQGQSATGNYDLFNIGIGRYGSTAYAVATIENFVSSGNNTNSAILKIKYTADSSLTANNNLIRFEDSGGFVGSINSEVTYSTFTGSHISAVNDVDIYRVGMIVSATGLTSDYVGIDNAQIRVQISDSPKDKRVMGVYTEILCLSHTEEELNEHGMWCDKEDEVEELPKGGVVTIPHECKEWHYSDSEGNRIPCTKEHFKSWSIHEDVIQYNALGEGMVLVSNVDGDIQTGDYITTSTHAGIGVLQDDDILHSYTVAKITQDIDWDNIEVDEEYGIKIALVTCTYHCG